MVSVQYKVSEINQNNYKLNYQSLKNLEVFPIEIYFLGHYHKTYGVIYNFESSKPLVIYDYKHAVEIKDLTARVSLIDENRKVKGYLLYLSAFDSIEFNNIEDVYSYINNNITEFGEDIIINPVFDFVDIFKFKETYQNKTVVFEYSTQTDNYQITYNMLTNEITSREFNFKLDDNYVSYQKGDYKIEQSLEEVNLKAFLENIYSEDRIIIVSLLEFKDFILSSDNKDTFISDGSIEFLTANDNINTISFTKGRIFYESETYIGINWVSRLSIEQTN